MNFLKFKFNIAKSYSVKRKYNKTKKPKEKRGRICDEDITVHVLGSICSCMHASESVDDVHVERRRDRVHTL
ncbi:hypothetical protein BpHYR1_042006 [Brachionus plicatilis]|uniref:Uncharacterized protein n=1 Tax=Brachionus plicatilis TaxID=10195 RepID=A0A3M7RUB4_BRAPC|nr:hypothetical protein BpHYR1_042006 [Brachionus plicatilis]